ncbi:MAG: glycosyltransferase [Synergistaceae bacterium]|nr:glycosyltransferase [Synergistaceae bacterium]
MPPLISVIVPAYNVEQRIRDTLESIMSQDYSNIEIIVVDDGSKDATADASRDILKTGLRQWRVIEHEKNRGVSGARNTGFRAATGEYVLFMDADDRADKDFISTLYEVISDGGHEIAFCGFREHRANGEERLWPIKASPSGKYSSEDLTVMLLLSRIVTGIWCVLFSRRFLEKNAITFIEGCSAGEDVEFTAKAFSRSISIGFSAKCPYVYNIHDEMGSIANASTAEQRLTRYIDNTEAHFRLTNYLMENPSSRKLINIARYVLLPISHTRRLNIYARQKDRTRFDAEIRDPETRSILWSSFRSIFWKPEVFLKSLLLLTFSSIYFRSRSDI